ncbi:ATP-dependent RNA helicase RhlE 2 [Nitzschia inconspicua]|uniref:ATP-dependent RNA helicase RhlE 2 n=1 Tax=Nitzschia inconspicua TaxID=303405 RepID=A0A9K3LB01_9STRA|nr:ATP-dependent RNA helicase RhlE 2 [Nitzschia inconspicua]
MLVLARQFKAGSRLWVRAFSSTATTSLAGARISPFAAIHSNCLHPQHLSYSTSSRTALAAGAQVDEDLDTALDELLAGNFDEDRPKIQMKRMDDKTSIRKTKTEDVHHMKNSKPVPSTLLAEDDPQDFTDPKFLSTSNPRWVQAGLDQRVIDVLSGKGITHFTPVQGEAFDPIVAGRDLIGRSRTGTGKTLAFGLPSLVRLTKCLEEKGQRDPHTGRMERGRPVSMLVLCPTRELARQVHEELSAVARPLGLFSEVFHGGVSYEPQSRALRSGLDILVGTPGRIIDHLERGNLNLEYCDSVVLDEADEMLSMGFADDVETILQGLGQKNGKKPQVMLFSATTPPWVKQIGRQYQEDVIAIDATGDEGGSRVATTVRHTAVLVPPGAGSKRAILEDIIAIEISKDLKSIEELVAEENADPDDNDGEPVNEIAQAALAKRKSTSNAMQQKIFGKTIVFTETKREADELVSGGVFKSLTAQALHGDVGQKQRDATLAAFRAGAFNVLVATDVAARGIDIKDVDLVVQFDPPRDVDTYVHRSGRTGRAGAKGVSVLMFGPQQQRDIVRIERDLGHGFQFELVGPPSIESALRAAAKTSAVASRSIPNETTQYFKDAAAALLKHDDPEEVVARCLAAISRRSSSEIESRSLITGELGLATVEMTNTRGRPVSPGDVMFTVNKLSQMSRREGDNLSFDGDVGKIQANPETGIANFDMSVEDAKKLVEFSKTVDAGGNQFTILESLEINRDQNFGRGPAKRGGGRFDNRGGGGGGYRGGGGGGYRGNRGGGSGGGGWQGQRESRGGAGGGYRRRETRNSSHDFRGSNNQRDRNGYSRGGGGGDGYSRGGGRSYNGGGNDGW